MKLTQGQLRKIIKEEFKLSLSEAPITLVDDTLYYQPSSWGVYNIWDDQKNDYRINEIIVELIDGGNTDIFMNPEDKESDLAHLQKKREENVLGGIMRWDPDVFHQYYGIDQVKAIQLYARLNGMNAEEVEREEEQY